MGEGSAIMQMYRRSRALKAKWRRGEPSPVVFITFEDPAAAEAVAGAGYDAAIIEAEHSPLSRSAVQTLVMAFKGSSTVPIVRVPIADQWIIKATLDCGACGVILPLMRTGDDARAAIAACRYPPLGIRGVAPRRAVNYGRETEDYFSIADESIIRILQIETAEAVENIDEILAVDGLDAILIGPSDLSASLGHLGDREHSEVEKTIDLIVERARGAGVPVAIAPGTEPEVAVERVKQGMPIVICGSDFRFLVAAADHNVMRFRELVADAQLNKSGPY